MLATTVCFGTITVTTHCYSAAGSKSERTCRSTVYRCKEQNSARVLFLLRSGKTDEKNKNSTIEIKNKGRTIRTCTPTTSLKLINRSNIYAHTISIKKCKLRTLGTMPVLDLIK